jgi:tetratricopeptide (TPR) repeat protein
VTAIAGVMIYLDVRAEGELAHRAASTAGGGAPIPSTPAQDALDGAAIRSRLVVLPGRKAADARPVVALGSPIGTNDCTTLVGLEQGILARELIRQSILIAARDELRLATRDEVLGDSPPAGQEGAAVEVVTLFRAGTINQALVRRCTGEHVELLLKLDLVAPESRVDELGNLVAVAETLSRTEFPGVLKQLGLEGKPNAISPESDLPGLVEDRLSHLGFTEPFTVVRDLHEAIRNDGESPERLGALVRGYAQLGVLTEFHWHPAHKAFKARALLYAQRLVTRDPKAPWGLWHRAYAEALVGMHRNALADLAEAKELAEVKDDPSSPAWVDLIDACVRYDLGRLRIKDGPYANLAALLRLMAVEFPTRSSLALRAAEDVLALDPECFRAHDAMCQVGGITDPYVATTTGPQVLTCLVPRKLRALGTLPASVRECLDREAGEVALVEALVRAGEPGEDAGEPSWSVLGHLIRETRFVQVKHRLHFMRVVWSVPVDDFWADCRPYVANHRYRSYLEMLALPPKEAARSFAVLAERLDMTDLEITEYDMIQALELSRHPRGQDAYANSVAHDDALARDLAATIVRDTEENQPKHARILLAVSPYSSFAMATLIDKDWPGSQPHLAEWERIAGDSPALHGALGRRYTGLGRIDEAQRVLSRYIRQSPDYWAYEKLAGNYRSRGDIERWHETLDEFLQARLTRP